jgi:hypothetical protein
MDVIKVQLRKENSELRCEVDRLRNELIWTQTVAMDYRRQAIEYRALFQK